jgi:hypothetical protein
MIDYCPQGQYVDVMDTRRGVDNNAQYDWWATRVNQQLIPGVTGCNDPAWQSSRVRNRVTPWSGMLFDYDPTTVAGNPYTPVDISISSGLAQTMFDLVWGWIFSTQDVSVLDYSSYFENWMEQEFVMSGAQTYTTNQSKPGLAVQQDEGVRPYYYRPMNIYFAWHGWAEFPHFDTWYVQY